MVARSNGVIRHSGGMSVLAVSFDADQTLWDFSGVQKLALAEVCVAMVDRFGIASESVNPQILQAARSEVAADFRGRPHNLEQVREMSFRHVLQSSGYVDSGQGAAQLAQLYFEIRFERIKLYPEVEKSLARIGLKHRLGLLSNGNTYPERCGLPATFDAVVLGPSYGFEKPDPKAFRTIARKLGVELGEMVHVGDDWDDIEGANLAGAVSVYINRDGANPEFRGRAQYEVRDLIELEVLLENLA